jgi:conjugal transfer/entry exclusion protein
MEQQWLESQRASLIHAQTLQNRVVAEMPATQQRVGDYVARSNSAPGQTAVQQASNETLATLAAQLQNLQALDVAQTRIELEQDAYRQAQAAFHRQRRDALMMDWPVGVDFAKSQTAVRSLFDSARMSK